MEMKQVVVTGQNEVELQNVSLRDGIGPEEVLIQTEYTFISAGTELANYTGKDANVFTPGHWNSYPWKSGYANVGIVREVGSNVTRVNKGQRVYTFGQHASAIIVSQRELIIEVPSDIPPAIAASSRMAGVAATSIILSDIPHNAWVAVFGLGMVGNLAAQMYRNLGCKVIGVEPNEHRRQLAQQCGLPITIGGSNDEVQQQIRELTGGKLAHITVDAVGHSSVVMQALQATASLEAYDGLLYQPETYTGVVLGWTQQH